MNPDSPKTPREELEARLTALLLGELSADEAAAVRRALAQDVELTKLHDRLQATIGLVREAIATQAEPVADQPPLRLSDERREKLLAHFKTVALAPKLSLADKVKRSWFIPMSAAAALVALLSITVLMPRFSSRVVQRDASAAGDWRETMSRRFDKRPSIAPSAPPGDLTFTWGNSGTETAAGRGEVHSLKEMGYFSGSAPPPGLAADVSAMKRPASSPADVMASTVASPPASASPAAGAFAAAAPPTEAAPAPRPGSSIVLPSLSQSPDEAKSTGTKYAVLDPEWAGVLEQPTQAHAQHKTFQGRYYDEDLGDQDVLAPAKPDSWYFDKGSVSQGDFYGQLEGRSTSLWDVNSSIRGFYSDRGSQDLFAKEAGANRAPTGQNQELAARGRGEVTVGQTITGLPAQTTNGVAAPGGVPLDGFYGGYAVNAPTPTAGGKIVADSNPGSMSTLGETAADKTVVLGDTPELGRTFYRITGGVGGGGSGVQAQPVPPPASPAPLADVGVVVSAATKSKGVELVPLVNGRELTEGARIAPAEKVQSMDVDALTGTTAAGKDVVGVALDEAARRQRSSIVLPATETAASLGFEVAQTEELARAKIAPARPSSGAARSESTRLVQDNKPTAELAKLDYEIAQAGTKVSDLRRSLAISEADLAGTSPTPHLEAETLNRLEGLRIETQVRYEQEQKLLGQLKSVPKEDLAKVLPTAVNDSPLADLSEQLRQAEKERDRLKNESPAGSDALAAAEMKAETLSRRISERADGIIKGLEARTESLKQGLDSLSTQVEKAKKEDIAKAERSRPYFEAKRNLEELLAFKKVRAAQAEVDRLRKGLTVANQTTPATTPAVELDASPVRKPSTNAPIPQPEVQTSDNAFSTFSLNVSDVAFKLAAASLEKGQMPDAASVRAEEFINAFDYRDPEAPPGVPIAFAWERARYPFAHNRDLLRFSLKTAAAGRQAGRPLNLVLLLDNSGSMERADRVQIIREALRVLAGQLQPQDKLSVITFARTPRLWVDGVAGDKSGGVLEQVSGLTPQGGTNLEEAMNLAYATALRHYLAGGINRVVLLTDGAANLGNVESEPLKQKVEAHRKQGIALDCFGIGWEGFNDDLLEVLSRNGDGRYGFINSPDEAATEFAGQLAGALKVAASDVKVQVEFNPKRVTAYRQIGYAKHQLTKEQFRDNTVDAAEIAAQEAGNALYTVEVNPAGEGPLCIVRCRFKIPGTTDYREHEWAVPYTGNAVSLEQASPAMRLAASASAFAEWLVVSPFAGEVTPDALLGYLSGVPEVYGADARPKKLEWMIRQAKSIGGK